MTIAVGVLSNNAFVIAADSQEGTGIGGELKQSIGKICGFSSGYRDEEDRFCDASICVAGAGDSAYIAVVRSKIFDHFRSFGGKPDMDAFGLGLEALIHSFYRDHVIPFEPSQMDLRVQFIVAAQSMDERRLWVTNLSTVMQPQSYTAIGSGERWALSVMPWRIYAADEQRASIAAAYGVFVAKSFAEGCGGEIAIMSIRPGVGPIRANPEAVVELEKLFKNYRETEADSVGAIFGLPPLKSDGQWVTFPSLGDRLESLSNEISSIKLFP